jgi:hypothetical protein
MKNGGWLDNYNDSKASAPEGMEGDGFSNVGRNYSPAWGGQFQMGGDVYPVNYVPQAAMGASMPGAVGFTYARTQSPAPSNGKYAKKTMPSAQGGKKIKIKDEREQAMKSAESTAIKRKDFDLVQSKDNKVYNNAVVAQKKEAARRAKLTKDQREREDYNAYNEERGSISKYTPETTWQRTKAIVSNPMTAAGYIARGENLPGNFQAGPRNEFDYATDWVNPLQGVAALSEIPGELGKGEFLEAGLSGLDALDLGVYAKGVRAVANPLIKKGVQQLGNVNSKGKIFSGMNNELNNMAIKNTEKYMAKRTPIRSSLSSEMEPYVSRYTKLSEEPYTPYQEDEYMKWFNEQKAKMNPSTPVQDPRSILRNSSVIDINDVPDNNFELFDLNNVRKPSGSIGNQGATSEGANSILQSLGIKVKGANPNEVTLKEMIEHLKNNPKDAATYKKFLEKEPINVSELPDGSYQINDGHHRATLSYYSGNENIPTIIKNKGEYIKQRDGGIIKDDRGQWDHPGEITEIGSNQITMQGVPYDVLGISDTGDTKLMKPGKNYKFKGKKVTEYPMAKNGLRQEQKGLVNLDNLLNFTNYNKPQPGGWLSKYE